jgi:hypothetical protein
MSHLDSNSVELFLDLYVSEAQHPTFAGFRINYAILEEQKNGEIGLTTETLNDGPKESLSKQAKFLKGL